MKEIYEKPITELEEFKPIDVLTVSGSNPSDDNDTPFPWG